MKFEYDKVTKTMEILDTSGLGFPVLLVNDEQVLDLMESNEYQFLKDGVYKIEVAYTSLGSIIKQELGHVLVLEYSKDRNRNLLISVLDEEKYDGIPDTYSKNRRLIREIENSFIQSNIRRLNILFEELSW